MMKEAELLRVKELNALNIVETKIEELKTHFQVQVDSSIAEMHASLSEKMHDNMSAVAHDLTEARDKSEQQLMQQLNDMKKHYDEQLENHKQLFDHIVGAL